MKKGSSHEPRQPIILSNNPWRSSFKANQLIIKESQSNHPRRIIWTCGLRRLVAYIRKEFTALDQSLVLVVGLLDLVAILPQGPRLIRMSLSYRIEEYQRSLSCMHRKGLHGRRRQSKGRKKIGGGRKRRVGGRKK
uniref:Uncharacterized protein LOC104213637 n=1 Tax=Nicotiana sylvestris TaxID=4096 RepID=A0A1U7V506_NICSY|nr:PREDICTED: uncharacterized protein LOC104213637 [Nicotiana sylvestris]